MRLLLAACLLLIACGDDDDPSGGSGAGGASGAGQAGRSGGSGRSSDGGRSSVAGHSGQFGGGTGGMSQVDHAGRGGNTASGGVNGGSGSGGSGPTYGTIKLVPNIVAGAHTSSNSSGIGSSQFALRVGQPSATTLFSLKYYISTIQLCEDLELVGSGFSNPNGCIDLYRNQEANQPDYSTYMVDAARNDTTEGRYIDLMAAEGQAALRKPVTLQVPIASAPPLDALDVDGGIADPPSQAGVYRYGLINFYRPIKVKAQFPIIGEPGEYFRTKAVSAIHTSMSVDGLSTDRVEIGDTLMGDTEETTYMLNNGGALFVFQKPFAITQADVDAQAEIKVDLVFNPENFGQAHVSYDCVNQTWVAICDPTNNVVIDMPFVRMSPVPRKAGQKARKETYLIDFEQHNQVRVELYYNDSDPEAGIQGVDTALVYLPDAALASAPSTNTIASNFVVQSGSVTTDDASVKLLDYRHMTNLEGLVRRHDGTVTIQCLFTGSVCPSLGGTVTRAYTYVGDSIVSSD